MPQAVGLAGLQLRARFLLQRLRIQLDQRRSSAYTNRPNWQPLTFSVWVAVHQMLAGTRHVVNARGALSRLFHAQHQQFKPV